MKFGVGDGFRFGCGFFLAVLVAYIIAAVVIIVLSLAGIRFLPALPQLFGGTGGLIP